MFLRRNKRKRDTEVYEYWTLVESVRTQDGPRQRIVATLGKLPGLDAETWMGWEHIREVLDGRAHQLDLLRPEPDPPNWATVDTSRMQVERLRHFGDVYLGLALWRRLKLDAFFDGVLEEGREEISWGVMACILTLARFCAPSSELQIAQFWYEKTALDELLDVAPEKVNDDRLYRALDAILPHKDALFKHFQTVYGELFGTTFDILLYDVTSTYFEGQLAGNSQAKRGYSRDKRSDCVQVCIALVVTPEGLPLAYEVFDGNRTDVTTVEEIVGTLREKYGQERRTWVMDRGMVSEDNIEMLQEAGASYLVGTPKSMLKQFEHHLLEKDWTQVQADVEVKLCQSPDGEKETFVLCRSTGRIEKERAMRGKQDGHLEKELNKLKERIDATKNTLRNHSQAERRVGRLFQKYSRAARLFTVTIKQTDDPEHKSGKRLAMTIVRDKQHNDWAGLSDGSYMLRTNLDSGDPVYLWKTYIGLTQIEDSFRISKHDLGLRPLFHHKQERTQAHILICFLSLVLWRTLQQWMQGCGLGTAPRKLREEMAELRSLDILLHTSTGRDIRLRTVSKPEPHLAILLQKLGLPVPNKPREITKTIKM
jgi:transposase